MSYEVIKATSIYKRSSIVPLIGDLAPRSRVYGHILCFFFLGKKHVKEKKAVTPKSHPASPLIYTHVYFVHIRIYNVPRFGPSGFFGPSRCRLDPRAHIGVPHMQCGLSTPGLTSEYPICSVHLSVIAHTGTWGTVCMCMCCSVCCSVCVSNANGSPLDNSACCSV